MAIHALFVYLCVRDAARAIDFYGQAFGAKEKYRLMGPDGRIAQAVRAGATIDRPIADQFYGKHSGSVRDPFGHRWNIGHGIEGVAPEEIQRRYYELLRKD